MPGCGMDEPANGVGYAILVGDSTKNRATRRQKIDDDGIYDI
jgi:hypothetical protein